MTQHCREMHSESFFMHPSSGFSRQHVVSHNFPFRYASVQMFTSDPVLSRWQGHLFWTVLRVVLSNFSGSALDDCIAEHSDDHYKQEVAGVHEVQVNERTVVIWNGDSELGIQCMIYLPNGTFVTPEWVVVLRVLRVWVSCCGEDLVPGRGITVGLWDTVRWLHCDREDITDCCDGHTGAEDHLLAMAMKNTFIWVPGCW